MKIKILEKCYTGTQGNMFKGDEHDIDDNIAEKLIARGFAEKAEAKKTKKLSNKSIKKLATPEDE